jgi:hypothetical protein
MLFYRQNSKATFPENGQENNKNNDFFSLYKSIAENDLSLRRKDSRRSLNNDGWIIGQYWPMGFLLIDIR